MSESAMTSQPSSDSPRDAIGDRSLAASLLRIGLRVTALLVFAAGPMGAAPSAPLPTGPEPERRDLPVTEEDLRILREAERLLQDEAHWNRADDRLCEDDEASDRRSLFCALRKACIEVLGGYDHRRAALQEVRFAVEEATPGVVFEHRLMGFNNLPSTRLSDVWRVLRVAEKRVRQRLNPR